MQSVANMVSELGSRESGVRSRESGLGSREANTVYNLDSSDHEIHTGNYNFDIAFKIFTSNKDLDGAVLQNVEFDKWGHYSENTEVW